VGCARGATNPRLGRPGHENQRPNSATNDGIRKVRTIRVSSRSPTPTVRPICFNDDESLSGALGAGASGFVLKDSSAEELIRAVRPVAQGDSYLDPAVTSRVLTTYRRVAGERRSV
jgi:DNA-binding NarL/FixJ family response regulator